MKFETTIGGKSRELSFDPDQHTVIIGGKEYTYSFELENGRYLLRIGTKLYKIDNVQHDLQRVEFTLDGKLCKVKIRDEQDLLLDRLGFKTATEIGEGRLNAPMPGKILEILVNEGDQVALGEPVAILEAMKMENELKSPVKGVVISIAVTAGDSVEKNDLILEIEASG